MRERTSSEKIILIGCLLGVIGVIPFTLYRFLEGDYMLAFIETCMAVSISSIFIYVWITHKTDVAAPLMSSIYLGVIIAAVHIKGPALIYWSYPVILSIFCILQARTALLFSLASMLLLFPALYPTLPFNEIMLIYMTLAISSLFGYSFTWVTNQKHLELSNLAVRDGLTGTLNRRALDESLELLISRHKHKAFKASLIIMDLDHFKNINDTYGHGVGDHILIKVAGLLRSTIRVSDSIYRYGGEEFVLVAEGADLAEAAVLAEKIRARVEDSQLLEKKKVTISLGVAKLGQNTSAQEWLAQADDALYQAKHKGRNQYCLADPLPIAKDATVKIDPKSVKNKKHRNRVTA